MDTSEFQLNESGLQRALETENSVRLKLDIQECFKIAKIIQREFIINTVIQTVTRPKQHKVAHWLSERGPEGC